MPDHFVIDLTCLAVLHTAPTREDAAAWLAADSKRVGIVMDQAALDRAHMRRDEFRRDRGEEPPEPKLRDPVQSPRRHKAKDRPHAVYVRMSLDEVLALDELRHEDESRAECVRRLVDEAGEGSPVMKKP